MKKLLFLLLFAPIFTFGQQLLQGRIRYLKTSNWTKQMASIDYLTPQQKEKSAYIWGNRAEWKVYCNLFFDETRSKYEDSDEQADIKSDDSWSNRKDIFCVTRDFSNNLTRDLMVFLGKNLLVEDTIFKPKWKILNDMKEVSGHLCMNASFHDTLRMQQIVAWFALDLPISVGPERFSGLPGAILEININNGGMILSADKIDIRPISVGELDLPKKPKGKKISEADFRAKQARFFKEKRMAEEVPFWGIRY
jgi:GLPGLI family protein